MSIIEMSSSPDPEISHTSSTKRKRDIVPENEDDKLEIDVNLPEPPSKKAKRKEKKQPKRPTIPSVSEGVERELKTPVDPEKPQTKAEPASKRADYGIWIGNLPYNATKDSLRQFLLKEGGIDEQDVTRVHLPVDEKKRNKGFAYIDFSTPAVLEIALSLSEKLTGGRRVLIKNAKSFEGRPDKALTKADGASSQKEPSTRVFVGNLSFDVTQADLWDHFSQVGRVEDIFMATFEDSGKCKGFAWVRFAEIEAAESAVKGFIFQNPEDEGKISPSGRDDDGEKEAKPKKPRKHFINRINGRPLRCEFAEDPQTRYKKRYGSKAHVAATTTGAQTLARSNGEGGVQVDGSSRSTVDDHVSFPKESEERVKKLDKDQRREKRKDRHDARTNALGQMPVKAQRETGAITAGAGKKITFD